MSNYTLNVSGMTCAACVATVEKAMRSVGGVDEAWVNFADNTATVSGSAEPSQVIQAIVDSGYGATTQSATQVESQNMDREVRTLVNKTIYAGVGGLLLFVVSMFELAPVIRIGAFNLFWSVLGVYTLSVLIYSGSHIFLGAWKTARRGSANMDTLVALGTGAAWIYSTIVVLFPSIVPELARHVYYEASAVIIAFINFGSLLELRARGKTSQAIKRLVGLQARTARVVIGKEEKDIPIEKVTRNAFVRVRPGEKIPVDGEIIEGESVIDESMITGEPIGVTRKPGDPVIGGTINNSGSFLFRATRVGEETMLARIMDLVKVAQNSKPPIGRLADRIASVFVPVVLLIALVTVVIWWFVGPEPKASFMLVTGMSVLVIACPCALGLATPISIMLGVNKAAEFGILIRDADALQKAGAITTVLLDKTGTVTEGKPRVVDVRSIGQYQKQEVLRYAAALESQSEHPLAAAIVSAAKEQELVVPAPEDFVAIAGKGIAASVRRDESTGATVKVLCGSEAYMADAVIQLNANEVADFVNSGYTLVYVAVNDSLAGVIAISDTIKESAAKSVADLKKLGIKIVLVSGDQENAVQHIAGQLGIEETRARVLPADKADEVKRYQQQGEVVAMVGDGINDAPALAHADVGFAIGRGTDVAIESANMTLVGHSIQGIVYAILISRSTMGNIKQNLFGAFIFNSLGIPIAAGILYPWLGFLLNPMIAAAAMAMSSVTVVSNANRLRFFTPQLKS